MRHGGAGVESIHPSRGSGRRSGVSRFARGWPVFDHRSRCAGRGLSPDFARGAGWTRTAHRGTECVLSVSRGRHGSAGRKYGAEPTLCTVGDEDNTIRESVTISRAQKGGGDTRWFDEPADDGSTTGYRLHCGANGCILANAATLAGHVIIEDFATVGGKRIWHHPARWGSMRLPGAGRL